MSLPRFLPASFSFGLATLAFAGPSLAAPVEWTIEDVGTPTTYIVEYSVVPEPSSAALSLALAGVALRRRRRGAPR